MSAALAEAPPPASARPLLPALRATVEAMVAEDLPDLTQRQLATLLILCTEPGPHKVKALAARLNVRKPAITYAMDRLAELGLAHRVEDPQDGRSPLLLATPEGRAHALAWGSALYRALGHG